ncbi:MAG: aspartyl-phosphate phosphatase Spo0E family protein [Bacillota bacterium]|nr:aspartyl-phosphate phosphatase Spo0E family protein [Bacillota bacterium]
MKLENRDIKNQIEELRDKLNKALQNEKIKHNDILKMSQELDEMLNLLLRSK